MFGSESEKNEFGNTTLVPGIRREIRTKSTGTSTGIRCVYTDVITIMFSSIVGREEIGL
jgi:hypothetical protein